MLESALARQKAEPDDRRAHEQAIGAGLLRWTDWADAVLRGNGAAYTVRNRVHPRHAERRVEFDALDVEIPGQKWALVEMLVVSRLHQANEHARSIGTLLYHTGVSSSVRGLLRMFTEACVRGLWIGDMSVDPSSALRRAIAEFTAEANTLPTESRRRLHKEVVLPAAAAIDLPLRQGKSGRWHPPEAERPSTRNLLERIQPLGDRMRPWAIRSYGTQSAAVHSSFQSWAASLVDHDLPASGPMVMDLLHVVSAHHDLVRCYEGWYDWQPAGAMTEASRAMMSGLFLALINARSAFASKM